MRKKSPSRLPRKYDGILENEETPVESIQNGRLLDKIFSTRDAKDASGINLDISNGKVQLATN